MSISKHACIILFFFLLINGALAQDNLPFTPDVNVTPATRELWLAPAAGFTPSVNALRLSAVSGNLVLNRAGAYVTIEQGLDSEHFTNIYGVTVTINQYVYLWGGVDLFTKRGLLHSGMGSRKEAGVGITPWNGLIVNTGWSKSVGFTFSLGWKLPIRR